MSIKLSPDLQEFKNVLDSVGHNISANAYDRLTIPRPARGTLERRHKKSWNELKAVVFDAQKATSDHKHLAEQNRSLLDRMDKERDVTKIFIKNCLAAIEKMNIKPVKIPKKIKTNENQDFFALRSDAHVGEYLEAEWVQGLSHYNAKTYKDRVQRWVEKIVLFKMQDQTSLGLNKLILNHLGDQVTGEAIYRGQSFYLDLHLTDQLFYSVEVEASALLQLAQHFKEIEVFCVVGNHGRPGMKGQNHHKTNFDYIFYRSLQMALKPQENIKIFVSESPSMIIQHGMSTFLLNHGDAAKSWAGIPFYGIDRMFRRLPGLYNMIIDYELTAHHHNPADLSDQIFMNGCLPGGSELSINKMILTSRASQKIFYFDKENGVHRKTDLYLSPKIQLTADENGIYTPYKRSENG